MNLNSYSKLPFVGSKIYNKYSLNQNIEDFFIMSSSAMPLDDFQYFSVEKNIESILEERKKLFPKTGDIIKRASSYDLKSYMVDLLIRQDKMTMAHSVENRVPFLDKKMVELVAGIPSRLLVRECLNFRDLNRPNAYTKYILKELAVKRFNKQFVYRKKSGFPLPLEDLFLNTKMNELIQDQLLPGIKSRGIFNFDSVSKIWNKKHKRFSNGDLKNLWMFFAFETWAQIFIDSKNYG